MPTATNGPGQSLYFRATTEETGEELYRIEAGSSTPTLIDINPGPSWSEPSGFFVL
jgi:ELWxxDGT repeat protein